MSDPIRTADDGLGLARGARPRLSGLVQEAPGPEVADGPRDRAGSQLGMALALTLGLGFWAAVGAAIWFFRH